MSSGIDIDGMRTQGKDVRQANIVAVKALANILKSSLGPKGLDKMIVDEVGDVTITNDGATILRQIEVEHPASRLLVQLSQLQDEEVGDGTTSVVILGAELLSRALEMIKKQIHPSVIINGYKSASKQAVTYIKDTLSLNVTANDKEFLAQIASTCLSSKLVSCESKIFSDICVKAILAVRSQSDQISVNNIGIIKAHGKSILDSRFFPGLVFRMSRVAEQMPLKAENARIACLDVNLSKFRLAMGIQVLVSNPKNLEQIRQKEQEILLERLALIVKSGANVIFTTQGMDDIASKYLVAQGVMGLRRIDAKEMKRLAKATGATVVKTFANSDGTETFGEELLGRAECVYEENLGDIDYIFVNKPQGPKDHVCSLILRGPNEFFLDEVDRSIHDALCVLKRALEQKKMVVGGGAVETAVSVYLEQIAHKSTAKDLTVIAEFAEALQIIPKQLALNAALDATDLLAKLLVLHTTSQENPDEKYKNLKYTGLDLDKGVVRNNLEAGILEPMVCKVKAIKFATEAAISILRIDDMIKIAPNIFLTHDYSMFRGKTDQELRQYLGLHEEFYKDTLLTMFQNRLGTSMSLPESFDWREANGKCIHKVRNQGKCGSCWAHSASEFLSDRICIKSKGEIDVVLSPQQLVDCDFIDQGCNGGFLTTPLLYYGTIGGNDELCYGPYVSGETGQNSKFCFLTDWKCKSYRAHLMSITILTNPQVIKEDIFLNGPVNTGFTVYKDFFNYKSGIYRRQTDEAMGGHAVKIVGWGQEEGTEYWIVQNSWSENWGENGFFRIAFGECGIDNFATSILPSL